MREALDVAVEHLANIGLNSNVIHEGREFFHCHLEWRVAQLRNLLGSKAICASPSLSSPFTSTANHDEQATVTHRSAMAETLTASMDVDTSASS